MSSYKYGFIGDERPDLVRCLLNPEDATRYRIGSAAKVDWVCPNCHTIIRNKSVNKIVSRGIPCPICSDGVSKPTKITTSSLEQVGISYITEKTFAWSNKRFYDFYLPQYNTIIEVHGSQHYGLGFKHLSGVTREDQVVNDFNKYKLAVSNGIEYYYIVNAKDTSARNIVPQLQKIFKRLGVNRAIDISRCEQDAAKSNVVLAAQMWNNGKQSGEISQKLNVSHGTVVQYLHAASAAGFCDYTSYKAHILSQQNAVAKLRRRVRCIETGQVFESILVANKFYNVGSSSNIIRSCNNKNRHAGYCDGVQLSWEYVDDEDNA